MSSPSGVRGPGQSPGRKWFYCNLISADCNSSPFRPEKWGYCTPQSKKRGYRYMTAFSYFCCYIICVSCWTIIVFVTLRQAYLLLFTNLFNRLVIDNTMSHIQYKININYTSALYCVRRNSQFLNKVYIKLIYREHCVSKKLYPFCFCNNFFNREPFFTIFGRNVANGIGNMQCLTCLLLTVRISYS